MVLRVLVEVSLPGSVVLGGVDWVFWVGPGAIESLDGIDVLQHSGGDDDLSVLDLSSVSEDDLVLVWLDLLDTDEFTVGSVHVDGQLGIWVIVSLGHLLHLVGDSEWVDLIDWLIQNDHTFVFSINNMIEMS